MVTGTGPVTARYFDLQLEKGKCAACCNFAATVEGSWVKAKGARIRTHWLIWLPRLWVGLVAVLLLWQCVNYNGIWALAAEWQFNVLGTYHPTITYLLLLLLLSSPMIVLRWLGRRRQVQTETSQGLEVRQLRRAIGATRAFRNVLAAAAIVVGLGALVTGASAFLLPAADGPVRRVVVTGTEVTPPLGPVELQGRVLYDKVAAFNQDLLITHTSVRFAPVVGEGASQSNFRFFVELPAEGPPRKADTPTLRQGVLRQGGLPGELVRLYRYAGFAVTPDCFVLFQSTASMRRPYFIDMVEFLIFSLLFGVLALGGSFRIRRLKQRMENVSAALTL